VIEMTADEFDILTAKVLAGDATPEEVAQLREALSRDPELRSDFAELQATWFALKHVGVVAQAVKSPPTDPPSERLAQWRAAVAAKLGPGTVPEQASTKTPFPFPTARQPRWRGAPVGLALAAAVVIAAVVAGALLMRGPAPAGPSTPAAYIVASDGPVEVRRKGPATALGSPMTLRDSDELHLPAKSTATLVLPGGLVSLEGPSTFTAMEMSLGGGRATGTSPAGDPSVRGNGGIETALFQPGNQLAGLLVTTRSSQDIRVYSPLGFTARRTPALAWESQPGKTYEVSIQEDSATAALLRLTKAVSPIEFTNAWPGRRLTNDGLYRFTVAESGKPLTATELIFRVLPEVEVEVGASVSDRPSEKLVAAYRLLTATPPRLGDALDLLMKLPPELASSELALRMKLFAFGQLGYQPNFDDTVRSLKDR
jgi:hypothetical protein